MGRWPVRRRPTSALSSPLPSPILPSPPPASVRPRRFLASRPDRLDGRAPSPTRTVAVFGGLEQLRGMDLGALLRNAAAREVFDRCEAAARPLGVERIPRTYEEVAAPTDILGHRSSAYLTLTALQIALFEREEARGEGPLAIYSLCGGHAAAAFAAGALDLEGAVRLATLYIEMVETHVRPADGRCRGRGLWVIGEGCRIPGDAFEATRTAPAVVLSDDHAFVVGHDVDALAVRLDALGVPYRVPRNTQFPTAHTPYAAPAEADFLRSCQDLRATPPARPWFSAGTGGWVADAPDASFWWATVSEAVRCGRDAAALAGEGFTSAVEVGQTSMTGARAFSPHMRTRSAGADTASGPGRLAERVSRVAREVAQRLTWRLAPAAPPETRAADALATAAGWRAWREHVETIRAAGGVARASDGSWCVTGYDDVKAILKDEATFSSSPLLPFDPVLLGTDGEAHQRVRRPLGASFSASALGEAARSIPEAAASALRTMAEQGETDLVAGFAGPLTLRLTWDLLGFGDYPVDLLVRWSALVHYEGEPDPEAAALFQDVIDGLYGRVTGGTADGVLAALGGVPEAEASPEAFASVLRALLVAGTVTTRDLIGNAVLLLLRHPDVEAEIRADRARIPAFLNEVLRLEGSIQRVLRRTTRRVEVGGQTVEAGALVVGLLGAANRDPAAFEDPETFRMDRPGRALSFGYGPHYCIGSYWAMQEATGALGAVLDAWPALEAGVPLDAIEITPMTEHGPVSLPMARPPHAREGPSLRAA